MFTGDFLSNNVTQHPVHKEGDLFKVICVFNKTFELVYGYYEQCDRINPLVDPVPLYPDFLKSPLYTEEGFPFITKMQDACEFFKGKASGCEECGECAYYKHGDELLGICICEKNKKK